MASGVTAFAVGLGVLTVGPTAPALPEVVAPEATTLAALETTAFAVPRADFCDLVPDDTVTEALGEEAATATSYGNGEQAELTRGVTDVVHEYSCTFQTPEGVTARTWVFAPPVTPAEAGTLLAGGVTEGCAPIVDAPEFGRSGTAVLCEVPGDEGMEATYRGLFGDAWFSCSLTGSERAELERRVDSWCAGLLLSLQEPPDA